jgi:hypothetical protein
MGGVWGNGPQAVGEPRRLGRSLNRRVPVLRLGLGLFAICASGMSAWSADRAQAGGTPRNGLWAFQRPAVPAVPRIPGAPQRTNPVDAFLLDRLRPAGLTFSPEADRRTLLRRLYLDVTGIPPTPEAVRDFQADRRPDAFERQVDALLASPHYGERWGRHWLDAAGFVETLGTEQDANAAPTREGAWRYRDYVIESLNRDKPYNRFLMEQLAGDELVPWRTARDFTPEITEALVATGFLRTAVDSTRLTELNHPLERYQVLHGTVNVVTSSILGLTVACAQCHDHKFDPIPQRDYYRLLALFKPAYNPEQWVQPQLRFLADVPPSRREEIDRGNQALDQRAAALASELKLAAGNPEHSARIKTEVAELARRRQAYGKVQALWETGPTPATQLFIRGDLKAPGPEVAPGFLSALTTPEDAALLAQAPPSGSSGRRLAFARWLTRSDHPLTARVLVNRVWQQYFGAGIVATSDNFGRGGTPPTHPALLDWLALHFTDPRGCNWRLKELHRLLLTSVAYRQTTVEQARAPGAGKDPENKLLWRQRLRRLESETIRDAVLATSGRLDRTMGGPSIPLENRPDGRVLIDRRALPTPTAHLRRSVYVFARRNFPLSLLAVFDQPVGAVNCTRRISSATPAQALTLLNNSFLLEQAEALAAEIVKARADAAGEQVRAVFERILCRNPRPEELSWSLRLVAEQFQSARDADRPRPEAERMAVGVLCQALWASNEFLYAN